MTAKQRYAQAMEWLYLGCVVLSGAALVVITLIIPLGVFMRYAMNSALSWPEPAAVSTWTNASASDATMRMRTPRLQPLKANAPSSRRGCHRPSACLQTTPDPGLGR